MEGGLALPAGLFDSFLGLELFVLLSATTASIEFLASFRFLVRHKFPPIVVVWRFLLQLIEIGSIVEVEPAVSLSSITS